MISTRDPETMTAEERRLEVAGILAAGLLRWHRAMRGRVRGFRSLIQRHGGEQVVADSDQVQQVDHPVGIHIRLEVRGAYRLV